MENTISINFILFLKKFLNGISLSKEEYNVNNKYIDWKILLLMKYNCVNVLDWLYSNNKFLLNGYFLFAVEYNYFNIIKWIHKINPTILKDSERITYTAFKNGHMELFELLIEYEADLNKILFLAIETGYVKLAKVLIEHGVNIHIFNEMPLRFAIESNFVLMAELLIQHGADIHVIDDLALQNLNKRGQLTLKMSTFIGSLLNNK